MRVLEETEIRERLFPVRAEQTSEEQVVRENLEVLLRESLHEEGSLTLSGLGTFRRNQDGSLHFTPWQRKRVFLAYVREDTANVLSVFRFLRRHGMDPWMDILCLLPGQNWPRAIERAIEIADFVVPCFSRAATRKRSHFQEELRLALHAAAHIPLDDPFIIPVRLEPCDLPRRIRQQTQYLDLFPHLPQQLPALLAAMQPAVDRDA
jgi:hypothetical protein